MAGPASDGPERPVKGEGQISTVEPQIGTSPNRGDLGRPGGFLWGYLTPSGVSGQWAGWRPDPAKKGLQGEIGLLHGWVMDCVGRLFRAKRLEKIHVR